MSFLTAVEAEPVVEAPLSFFRGNPAGAVGVGPGGLRQSRWWPLVVVAGSVGIPILNLFLADLLLALPMPIIEGDEARLEVLEGLGGSGVAVREVLSETTVQTPIQARAEGVLVPVSLGGEGFELCDVLVNVVGLLHLKECEPFFDNMPVLRISEAGPELVPEVVCGLLKLIGQLPEFVLPPLKGSAFQIGAGKDSLACRV